MSDSLRRVMNGKDRGEGTQKEKKLVQEKLNTPKVELMTFLIKIDSNVEDSTNLKYHPRLVRSYADINSLLAQTSDDSAVCQKILCVNLSY